MPKCTWGWGPAGLITAATATALLLPPVGLTGTADAQETAVLEGTVFDAVTLEPLEGVTVSILGREGESVTGAMGAFALEDLPAGEHQIRVRRSGYTSSVEDVAVQGGARNYIQLSVVELSAVLDELLVRGQREERRMSEIRSDDDQAANTAADLLRAKLPGMYMSQGGVGVGSAFRIRGMSSLTVHNPPLIIVDGVRVNAVGSSVGGRGQIPMSILDEIPASEVESIEVLKGPATAVRYPESADGVVLVTTRRGAGSDSDPE